MMIWRGTDEWMRMKMMYMMSWMSKGWMRVGMRVCKIGWMILVTECMSDIDVVSTVVGMTVVVSSDGNVVVAVGEEQQLLNPGQQQEICPLWDQQPKTNNNNLTF